MLDKSYIKASSSKANNWSKHWSQYVHIHIFSASQNKKEVSGKQVTGKGLVSNCTPQMQQH